MQNRGIGRMCHKVKFLYLGKKKIPEPSVFFCLEAANQVGELFSGNAKMGLFFTCQKAP